MDVPLSQLARKPRTRPPSSGPPSSGSESDSSSTSDIKWVGDAISVVPGKKIAASTTSLESGLIAVIPVPNPESALVSAPKRKKKATTAIAVPKTPEVQNKRKKKVPTSRVDLSKRLELTETTLEVGGIEIVSSKTPPQQESVTYCARMDCGEIISAKEKSAICFQCHKRVHEACNYLTFLLPKK